LKLISERWLEPLIRPEWTHFSSSISWRDIDAEEINQRFTEIIILL
jgi:hypothetical protein